MLTRTERMVTTVTFTLLLSILGCGPSGRKLSDEQWLALHAAVQKERNGMQAERAEFARQRDRLEADRRNWDARARTEPVVAASISAASLVFCCSLPLILVALLLWPRRPEPADEAISELLISNLVQKADRTKNDPKRIESKCDLRRLETPSN